MNKMIGKCIVSIYLSVLMSQHALAQSNCGYQIRSTCSYDLTTKWNAKFVGNSLKKWFSSLTNITSIQERYENHTQNYTTALKLIMGKNGNAGIGVEYISNLDCSTKQSIGPTWMKPSNYSSNLLEDGFLYGQENDLGEMTGYIKLNS